MKKKINKNFETEMWLPMDERKIYILNDPVGWWWLEFLICLRAINDEVNVKLYLGKPFGQMKNC